MKKFIVTLLLFISLGGPSITLADWWARPSDRPTPPAFDRNIPTEAVVQPTVAAPTNTPIVTTVPTATPRIGEPSNPPSPDNPTSTPIPNGQGATNGGGGDSKEDACAPGKSFSGPYCGWTPQVDFSGKTGGGEQTRVGGPQVLGLSDTSSNDLALSDIMILTGLLCLLVYARSKFIAKQSR